MIEIINNETKCEGNQVEIIRKEYAQSMLDLIEELLDEKDIDIPSDDREGDECEARLYGSEYYDMEDKFNKLLDNFQNDVLNVYDVQIEMNLVDEEVVNVLVSELGYNKESARDLINSKSKDSFTHVTGGKLVYNDDNTWTLYYFK